MQLRYEIPDTFWSLFRSVNREIYMESLLVINEEYQYSNCLLYTSAKSELKTVTGDIVRLASYLE